MPTTEQNLSTLKRYVDQVWNASDPSVIGEVFSDDFVAHDPDFAADIQGVDGAKDNVAFYKLAFPDMQLTVEEMFGEGDRAAMRWTASGTHMSEFMGIDPFGKQVSFSGMSFFHFGADGKIVEEWTKIDVYRLFAQLGALEEPQPQEDEQPIGQPASDQPYP